MLKTDNNFFVQKSKYECKKLHSSTVTFWGCDAEVTSSFVIFAVLVLRVVLTRLCKL